MCVEDQGLVKHWCRVYKLNIWLGKLWLSWGVKEGHIPSVATFSLFPFPGSAVSHLPLDSTQSAHLNHWLITMLLSTCWLFQFIQCFKCKQWWMHYHVHVIICIRFCWVRNFSDETDSGISHVASAVCTLQIFCILTLRGTHSLIPYHFYLRFLIISEWIRGIVLGITFVMTIFYFIFGDFNGPPKA